MRIDLLKKWLKMCPYGYCYGMNFQTCRATESDCPYAMYNVNCSDSNAAVSYYSEMLRHMRMKPRKARKAAIMFAETYPSILKAVEAELRLDKQKEARTDDTTR